MRKFTILVTRDFRFLTFIIFGIFLLEIFIAPSNAGAETKSCDAVDKLSEIYYRIEDIKSVGVYGDEENKFCQFSINGATKDASEKESKKIANAVERFVSLKEADKNQDKVISLASEFGNSLAYLLVAPNLQNFKVVDQVFSDKTNYPDLINKCIIPFYLGEEPKLSDKSLSCSIADTKGIDTKGMALSIKVLLGSFYELIVFRK